MENDKITIGNKIFTVGPGVPMDGKISSNTGMNNLMLNYFEDIQMVTFIQVLFGYCLTNRRNPEEGDLFCFYGKGKRGKTALFTLLSFLQPYFRILDGKGIVDLALKKKQDTKAKEVRTSLIDGLNEIELLVPFLNLKNEGKLVIPGNEKFIVFSSGVTNSFLDKHEKKAFFIPLMYRFEKEPSKSNEKKLQADFNQNLERYKDEFIEWVIQGSNMYYEKGLNFYIPKD